MRVLKLQFNISLTYFAVLVAMIAALGVIPSAHADLRAKQAFEWLNKKDYRKAYETARQSQEPYVSELMQWYYMRRQPDDWKASEMMQFVSRYPNWPKIDDIRRHIEGKFISGGVSVQEIKQWFNYYPPISAAGELAQLMAKNPSHRLNGQEIAVIQKGWEQADLPIVAEAAFLAKYRSYLNSKHHFARADRLVWERQYGSAKRMLPLISKAEGNYIRARIALQSKNRKGPSLFSKVTSGHRKLPGMIYSRLVWRHSKKDHSGAKAMLDSAPKAVPYPDKWWKYRERYVRDAIEAGGYSRALKMLLDHGMTEGAGFAEAEWLAGWVLLEKKNDAKSAYARFDNLYRNVSYAISRARAAYWAGRAAEKMGQIDTATSWYKTAAGFPVTFYGQLAHNKIYEGNSFSLPAVQRLSDNGLQSFAQSDPLAGVLNLCFKYDQPITLNTFIKYGVLNSNSSSQIHMLAALLNKHQSESSGVKAAKRALQKNIYLASIAFPQVAKSAISGAEFALVNSITRQESEFDPEIKSRAGAVGLMQLMPGTARHVAKKLSVPYHRGRLTNPSYNVMLGSSYIGEMLERYNGSYVLAIAAYNAGPGNVDKWIKRFGRPGNNVNAVINWIEKIPFDETRNYVQRVLENLQVYRYLLERQTNLQIENDLVR